MHTENKFIKNSVKYLLVFTLVLIGTEIKAQNILPNSGFYDGSVLVEIDDIPGNYNVYYTLDGTPPNQSSPIYVNPVQLSTTTTLSVSMISADNTDTLKFYRSYLIDESTELPVITLTSDPDNFFSDESGIYVEGTNGIPGNCRTDPVNWNQEWEIPVHITYFDKDRSQGFDIDAGIQISGGCTRMYDQKSLGIYFRKEYGQSNLKYQVFEDKSLFEYKRLVLRNGGQDWYRAMLRNEVIQTLTKDHMDVSYQAFKPVVVFLNGDYWGIHMLTEKKGKHYLEANYGFPRDEIDILRSRNTVKDGSATEYNKLLNFIENNSLSSKNNYDWVAERMDVSQFMDYQIAEIFTANGDWPGGNIMFWRSQNAGEKWRWLMFDMDMTMGSHSDGIYTSNNLQLASSDQYEGSKNPGWSTLFLRKLLENEEFRSTFIQRYNVHMQTTFQKDRMLATVDEIAALFESEVPAHMARWGKSFRLGGMDWESHIDLIKDFIDKREFYARQHLQQKFNLGTRNKLNIQLSEGEAGSVWIENQEISPVNGITLYNGIATKVVAKPAPGYSFVGWSGALSGNSIETEITMLGKNETIKATFARNENAKRQVVINEVNYKSADSHDTGDWVEFYNNTSQNIDISGWYFSDEKDSHAFYFPINTILQSNGFIVLSEDIDAFNSFHPDVENVVGNMDFGLSKSGELIRLINNNGEIVDSLTYKSEAPWPTEPNGLGATMALVHPNLDGSDGNNWAASFNFGTPGRANTDVMVSNEEDFISDLPQSLELEQNYPNPFNPSTIIGYAISQPTEVKLTIYSVTGAKIAELINQRQNAGRYQVVWEASAFASGIYFYRLEAQGTVLTKKLTLIK